MSITQAKFLLYNKLQDCLRQNCFKNVWAIVKCIRQKISKKYQNYHATRFPNRYHICFCWRKNEKVETENKVAMLWNLIDTRFNVNVSVSVRLHFTIYICNWITRAQSFVFPIDLFIFEFHSFKKYKCRYLSTTDTYICRNLRWTHMHSVLLVCYSYLHEFTVNLFKMIT